MLMYLPRDFYIKSDDGEYFDYYSIKYDDNGMPESMKIYDKKSMEVVEIKAKKSLLAGCTHVALGKIFFLYDEQGNILRHTLLKTSDYYNDLNVSRGIVEYTYNFYENSMTQIIRSNKISISKLITENSGTINEFVGRYQLCGFPQTKIPKKMVVTNGSVNGKVVNTIKVLFGVYDYIIYYRYNNNPRRVIVRKTMNGNVAIINNTIAELDDIVIKDSYQNIVYLEPDGNFERYVVFEDEDSEKGIISATTFNEQGHQLVQIERVNLCINNKNYSCKMYFIWQEIETLFLSNKKTLNNVNVKFDSDLISEII